MHFRLVLSILALAAAAAADVFPDASHIYVEGSAEVRVEPDTLELSLEIEATDPELATAKASVDERSQRLIAACRKLGVAREDLTSTSLHIGPHYDYSGEERKLLGTRVHRQIDVTLRDLARYAELIDAIVAADVSEISASKMSSTKEDQVIDEAQKAALADARARADRLARASGQELGPAYSISEFDHRTEHKHLLWPAREIGGVQRVQPNVSALGGRHREPFEPGTIVATATVYVIYLLEGD